MFACLREAIGAVLYVRYIANNLGLATNGRRSCHRFSIFAPDTLDLADFAKRSVARTIVRSILREADRLLFGVIG